MMSFVKVLCLKHRKRYSVSAVQLSYTKVCGIKFHFVLTASWSSFETGPVNETHTVARACSRWVLETCPVITGAVAETMKLPLSPNTFYSPTLNTVWYWFSMLQILITEQMQKNRSAAAKHLFTSICTNIISVVLLVYSLQARCSQF